MMKKKGIGIALGSGGARGWAHVGVLRALAERDIAPRYVAGASMGALVGGVYAAGTLDVLYDFALELDWKEALLHFVELNIPRTGLIEGARIVEFVRRYIPASDFSALRHPFRAVATDLWSGAEIVLESGDAIEAIRASISIPGIFTPVRMGERWLVDGGLSNPVPVTVARAMGARRILAVDVSALTSAPAARPVPARRQAARAAGTDNPLLAQFRRRLAAKDFWPASLRRWRDKGSGFNMFDVMGQTVRLIEAQISAIRLEADRPDVLLRPEVGHISFMEFHRAPEAIEAGYQAAREQMAAIEKLV